MSLSAIVSIHDVMPHTMGQITRIVGRLQPFPADRITLLVVPGCPWEQYQLDQLRRWQTAGYTLAGHGWVHYTSRIDTVFHKLHSTFISRDVAEHLSLSTQEVRELIGRNFAWWESHGFAPPDYYVPPAWAMGRISRPQLAALPFRYYETTSGLLDAVSGRFKRLPLAGFEADTGGRALFLRTFNRLNKVASSPNRPLRISLHPHDFDHRLGDEIMGWLTQVTEWVDYREVFK